MANAKIQPFTSLDQSKHHCYTLSTTCILFKLASEVGPRTNRVTHKSDVAYKHVGCQVNKQRLHTLIRAYSAKRKHE